MRHAAAGLLIALCLAVPAVAAPAPARFDAELQATKQAMLADPGRALVHARNARMIAERTRGPAGAIGIATAQWLEGEALTRLDRIPDAKPVIAAALLTVERAAPNTKLHGDLARAQGNIDGLTGSVQAALGHFQRAYDIYRLAAEPRGQAMALQNIAALYIDAKDYDRALRYSAQSAEAYDGDPALTLAAHNDKGRAMKALGRLAEAETEFRQSVTIARKMKSGGLEEAVLENLASTQVAAGRLAAADDSIARAVALAEQPGAGGVTPFLWGVRAQAALKRGRFAEADAFLRHTFSAPGADTDTGYLEFHRTGYQLYKRLGQDGRALAHLEAYKRLDDRAQTLAASTSAQLMAARFDFANQDLKIARLQSAQIQRDAALAASRAQFQRTVFLGLLGVAAIVLALLLAGFISIRRSRNEVRDANDSLSDSNRQLEKALKAKTEFLATTSHEIRTPLNGILGMTQVILADRTVAPAVAEKIKLVHGAGETMRALIDDILDVAKMETGNLTIHRETMDLKQMLDETARLWSGEAERKGIALDADIASAPRLIVEDSTRLRQILFNLMSNAVKFTHEGTVRLSVVVEPAAADAGESLLVRVSDSGIGIPTDKLEEIFESFKQVDGGTTRQFGGTGLGLAICRNLAEALGGTISAESILGEGATFTVRLPLVRADGGEEAAAGTGLLLVEANPLAQGVLKAVLARSFGVVTLASDVAAALSALRSDAIGHVLLDGATAAAADDRDAAVARIVAAAGARPVTMICAGLTDEDARTLAALGVARALAKPITAPALLAALRDDGQSRAAA